MLLTCIITFFASGCITIKNEEDYSQHVLKRSSAAMSGDKLEQLQALSQDWLKAKPDVERLLVVEHDLKLLLNRLNAHVKQKASENDVSKKQTQPVSSQVKFLAPSVKKNQ